MGFQGGLRGVFGMIFERLERVFLKGFEGCFWGLRGVLGVIFERLERGF